MTETEMTEMFNALARDVAALPARIKRAREAAQAADDQAKERWAINRAELAGHHAAIDEADAAHRAKCAERERGLGNREAAVSERERAVQAERQRISEREKWVEHRASDLAARYRGAA